MDKMAKLCEMITEIDKFVKANRELGVLGIDVNYVCGGNMTVQLSKPCDGLNKVENPVISDCEYFEKQQGNVKVIFLKSA